MVRDVARRARLCDVSDERRRGSSPPEAPIVLLGGPRGGRGRRRPERRARQSTGSASCSRTTPLHHLLLARVDVPLVATSGNLSDEPIAIDEREALARLGAIADLFLVHDRPIERHADDSVGWLLGRRLHLLRRARGFAPLPVPVGPTLPAVLAVGAHLKNVVGLAVGREVVLSQHLGDLETPEALAAFERVIADLVRLWEVPRRRSRTTSTPTTSRRAGPRRAAAGDESEGPLPPVILEAAREGRLRLVPVQHHHAHLAACLAENGADGPALGVTWDGTGYGTDGTVWGGEFLLGDAAGFAPGRPPPPLPPPRRRRRRARAAAGRAARSSSERSARTRSRAHDLARRRVLLRRRSARSSRGCSRPARGAR